MNWKKGPELALASYFETTSLFFFFFLYFSLIQYNNKFQ